MRFCFYTLLILFFSLSIEAQLSHTPNPLAMSAPKDSLDVKLEITFNNPQDTVYTVHWKLFKDPATWKNDWGTYVCDLMLCYNVNTDRNSPNIPNSFLPGTSKFEFHFLPNNTEGCTIVGLKLYSDKELTQEIYSTNININNCTSSTKNAGASTAGIKVFPNPTEDFIQVTDNSYVKRIVIYNIFGKQVKTFFHLNATARYDIGDLKDGMYIVKLQDAAGKDIRTQKLLKKSERP